MKLYHHPLSSYSQKTIMAFHEKGQPFTPEVVDLQNPEARAAYAKLYPLAKVPLLVLDDGYMIPESSIIIEWLDTHVATGTRLIPANADEARKTRFLDRQADLYLNANMQLIFFDGMKPEAEREPARVARARAQLDLMYGYLDQHFAKRTWAMGEAFTMADCATAPSLGYLRLVHPFEKFANLRSYFGRLAERPSYVKVQEAAAPYLAAMSRPAK